MSINKRPVRKTCHAPFLDNRGGQRHTGNGPVAILVRLFKTMCLLECVPVSQPHGGRDLSGNVEELIEAARAGSSEALGRLFEAWRDYLLLMANRELESGLLPKAGASDLVQDAFLEAQQRFAGFRGHTQAEFVAWLKRILHNHLANFTRAYSQTDKRRVALEIPLELSDSHGSAVRIPVQADTESPSAQLMAEEEWQRLRAAMERLPDDYRQVIVLRHQEGRSYAEIGQAMGRSEEAARKLWVRAVERLSEDMGLQQ